MSEKRRGKTARLTIEMKNIILKEVPVLVRPCVLYTMEGTTAAQVILYVQLLLCAVDVDGIEEQLKDDNTLNDVVEAVHFLREQCYLSIVDLETARKVCEILLPDDNKVLKVIAEAVKAQNPKKSETAEVDYGEDIL